MCSKNAAYTASPPHPEIEFAFSVTLKNPRMASSLDECVASSKTLFPAAAQAFDKLRCDGFSQRAQQNFRSE